MLHIDVVEEMGRKSWRWFQIRVRGFLSTDTPLSRHFAPSVPDSPPSSE